jgi:hypothetical protein
LPLFEVEKMSKGKAPKAPDYVGAANATAAGNADAARIASKANRVDQYTPYGSMTYYNPTSNQFNQAGFDAAMQTYQTQLAKYNAGGEPRYQGTGFNRTLIPGTGPTGTAPTAPTREQFMQGYDPDRWAMRVDLSPEQQQLLDAENKTSIGLAGLEDKGLSYVSNMLSTPFDQSRLPAQTINAGETAQDAILRRLQPQMDQQNEALRSRMANQGITLGSDAYTAEQRNQAMRDNDLRLAAAIKGIDVGNQARQQGIQEQAFFRNEPLNTLNAVRSGAQVTNPTFSNVPQQQTTAGPDLLGAANSQYGAQMNAYNAQQAQGAGLMGGLFSLGGAALGSPWLGSARRWMGFAAK